MPYFPGPWLPRRDDKQSYPLYCASMLALFQPWRSLADLKPAHVTFEEAFNAFTATAAVQVLKMIDNIQYFYDCSDKARKKQVNQVFDSAWTIASSESTQFEVDDDDAAVDDLQGDGVDDEDTITTVTELDIESALQDNFSTRELLYADVAVNIAEDFSIFSDDPVHGASCPPKRAITEKEMEMCMHWQDIMKKSGRDEDVNVGTITTTLQSSSQTKNTHGTVELQNSPCSSNINQPIHHDISDLNDKQLMAYTIVRNTLLARLAGQHCPQLLMLIFGEGGTGKSRLLDAITQLFATHNCESKLARIAMSGVAASIIKGSTLHSWAGLPPRQTPRTDRWVTHPQPEMAERRHNNIDHKFLLAVDEGSMLTTEQLTLLSQVENFISTLYITPLISTIHDMTGARNCLNQR
jgi:hypothetical protein